MKRITYSQRGYTLIEMMITVSIIAGVSLLTSQLMVQVATTNRSAEVQSTLATIRDNYIAIFNDDILPVGTPVPPAVIPVNTPISGLWTTIASTTAPNTNPTMNCLRTGGNCFGVTASPFTPLMRNGQPFMGYRPVASPTAGFRKDGTVCNTWVAPPAAPVGDCIIRVDFRWSAICPANPCTQPQVELVMTFQTNLPRGSSGTVNSERYNVTIRKDSSATVAGLLSTGDCPAGQFMTGFGANGQPICSN